MDIAKILEELESKYYGEWEEDRDALVTAIAPHHKKANEDEDTSREFMLRVINNFGGAYIPYIFWDRLNRFLDSPEDERPYLHEILKALTNSGFEEQELKKIKPLVVTYFATEKEFEVNKLNTLVVAKAHPSVQEYFEMAAAFVEKNEKATHMYKEKFDLVRSHHPDFNLMREPLSVLKERS